MKLHAQLFVRILVSHCIFYNVSIKEIGLLDRTLHTSFQCSLGLAYPAKCLSTYLPLFTLKRGACMRSQDMAFEARLLMWAMVEHNMRILSDFIKCNMENLSSPRVADQAFWLNMLVRDTFPSLFWTFSLVPSVEHL